MSDIGRGRQLGRQFLKNVRDKAVEQNKGLDLYFVTVTGVHGDLVTVQSSVGGGSSRKVSRVKGPPVSIGDRGMLIETAGGGMMFLPTGGTTTYTPPDYSNVYAAKSRENKLGTVESLTPVQSMYDVTHLKFSSGFSMYNYQNFLADLSINYNAVAKTGDTVSRSFNIPTRGTSTEIVNNVQYYGVWVTIGPAWSYWNLGFVASSEMSRSVNSGGYWFHGTVVGSGAEILASTWNDLTNVDNISVPHRIAVSGTGLLQANGNGQVFMSIWYRGASTAATTGIRGGTMLATFTRVQG